MKKTFIHYHIREKFDHMLENALIILDTNSMLNLYRYNIENREKYLDILSKLKSRLFTTHQILTEFYRNRYNLTSCATLDFLA